MISTQDAELSAITIRDQGVTNMPSILAIEDVDYEIVSGGTAVNNL